MVVPVIPHRAHVGQLTGVRAFAALAVLAMHYQVIFYGLLPGTRELKPLVDSGGLGLLAFFTLSGFIISYNYMDKLRTFSGEVYRKFMWARIARMYPVHITVLFGILFLYVLARVADVTMPDPQFYRVDSFIVNVFMLQGLFTGNPWNAPAWTITLDLFSYILFPLLVVFLIRFRSATSAYAAAGLVIVSGTAAMIGVFAIVQTERVGGVINWMHVTFEFICGALLYVGWRLRGFRTSMWWDAVVVGCVGAIVAMVFVTDGNESWRFTAVPLLALSILAVAASAGPAKRLLISRPIFWLGQISYSLYLTHVTVRAVVRQVLPPESYASSGLAVRIAIVVIYFAAAIAVGALVFHFVEEPGRKLLRRMEARLEARRKNRNSQSPVSNEAERRSSPGPRRRRSAVRKAERAAH